PVRNSGVGRWKIAQRCATAQVGGHKESPGPPATTSHPPPSVPSPPPAAGLPTTRPVARPAVAAGLPGPAVQFRPAGAVGPVVVHATLRPDGVPPPLAAPPGHLGGGDVARAAPPAATKPATRGELGAVSRPVLVAVRSVFLAVRFVPLAVRTMFFSVRRPFAGGVPPVASTVGATGGLSNVIDAVARRGRASGPALAPAFRPLAAFAPGLSFPPPRPRRARRRTESLRPFHPSRVPRPSPRPTPLPLTPRH